MTADNKANDTSVLDKIADRYGIVCSFRIDISGKSGRKKYGDATVDYSGEHITACNFDWTPSKGVEPGKIRLFIPLMKEGSVKAIVNGKETWKHDEGGENIISPELMLSNSGTEGPELVVEVRCAGFGQFAYGGVTNIFCFAKKGDIPQSKLPKKQKGQVYTFDR